MEPESSVVLRAPGVSQNDQWSQTSSYQSPSLSFLQGTWHVTHSTLPMWKSKRNVQITYTALPPSTADAKLDQTDRLDDVVSYQGLDSDKLHTVHGVDKASGGIGVTDVWDWRGKGWLMIASSHWEVLGWADKGASQDSWVVTYFAKTLFTPAGIDFYSRRKEGLSEQTIQDIKAALSRVDNEDVRRLSSEVFEVRTDHSAQGDA
ncbi:hypothetical protein AUEXF2481DRAFT_1640 [Aureobasidium subglaciale EXF-2481]|uniref:Lipocalin-like domain-containing protein n=1 Tax=Aureobasidium subglaciale (strain EXF-2481) TaxID=1043005 RepID=A0A074ZJZ4_AURSE|nr:uncharacterized protein AUEXF2481DRAFT_1640 [Aureobasidium subglaciale EXF-2481]KAI5203803.1 hypothetical protein E4T38_04956 [Aureobasidium subglaciale]KAI5222217.1 hypothetical protein E4T40_04994 [Aureobasidium subglaciale]KAI5226287.1 hypothetical protein E4T41_04813 [Aureobasidium subglaciale]KAI5262125.1 hypothetical protein E4T46_04706 [Aureobasidium subglaciale]KEQ98806.1 hypothetical protein AUEXF2481DRAFT_1640 [Aureobasidium subglaciale EXF-2481]